jgi:outer membrane protein OmpA-like peptidoglycan-associated protein
MRARLDPWPAIADLFSGLLIATFGSVMLFTHLAGKPDPVDVKARRIRDEAVQSLRNALGGDQPRPCGDDVCVDVPIEFVTSRHDVRPDFSRRIRNACSALQSALGDTDRREALEIFVEGHTDKRQLVGAGTPKQAYLYNWDLSTRRATAVVYEFRGCGVARPNYRIVAIGYADTAPLCSSNTAECLQKNRRTTFRLRPDKSYIAKTLPH